MKKIYTYLMMLTVSALIISCNEEWSGEQYEHYISFKAPINSDGVSRINVRYKANEATTYQVPLIVSGTHFKMIKTIQYVLVWTQIL